MLPARSRLRSTTEFTATTRGGRRSAAGRLVLHLLSPSTPESGPSRVGLTVGKAVGNAVVRHRTARRLRHLAAPRLGRLPGGSTLVIRALAGAGEASSAALAQDLDAGLDRLLQGSTA